ncbi:TIGR02186 family protein [Parasulfitobacter algicola]|uniref:TIGR02186 family protein n=1 Tax=Parasulfitobacter algicola TaxID=2614809 RepID=A0ABX2J1L0_9RHOB|nr:TIGR02186 family protein [Sulfitobacter algicola]NSX56843.1 TIGR02186 family protein [Sulfitobacter algicola]
MIRFVFAILFFALPATAQDVVAGLSQKRVAITASFDGSEILIFGAVKREAPIDDDQVEVIITVAGPSEPVTVRRKSRRLGIWINTSAVEVDAAPSFYSIATTGPLNEILTHTSDFRHKISIPSAIRSVGAPQSISDASRFTDALIRIRKANSLYQLNESTVEIADQTLFQTNIALPANLVEGSYETRIFLTRNGKVISTYTTAIDVQKVGLERWIYNLAHERPLIYGFLSLFIAISAGWLASAAFRAFRG